MYTDFRPPRPSPSLIALARWLFPAYLKFCAKLSVTFANNSLKTTLQGCADKRTVFIFNHPDRLDPLVLGWLERPFKQSVSCVVARECFNWDMGLRGLFFQTMGCYSVNRGAADIKSIRMTKNLLGSVNAKLIVFPEGKITCDNFHIHELQSSFMHILLDSQAELLQETIADSILIVPVATRYELETTLDSSFPRTLRAIESKLSLRPSTEDTVEQRIQRALDQLINDLLDVYHLKVPLHLPTIEKVERLADHICHKIGSYLDFRPEACDARDCHLYVIRNLVAKALDEVRSSNAYQHHIYKNARLTYKQFLIDLDRVERLLICHANLERNQTEIQACRTADFIEYEIFGRMTAKGKQIATVNFGQPLQVASYLDLYAKSKRQAVEQLSIDAKNALQEALDGIPKQRRSERAEAILDSAGA